MYSGEIVGRRIKPTKDTTLAKLRVGDQIKLLFSRFSNDDVAELDAAEKMSAATLKMKASLSRLIGTVTDQMQAENYNSATLSVSSEYIPYLDDVINPITGLGRYYDFDVKKRDLPLNVKYKMIITVRKRVSDANEKN